MFSVNELAEKITAVGKKLGYKAEITRLENPRQEQGGHSYNPKHTGLLEPGLRPRYPTDSVLEEMLRADERYQQPFRNPSIIPRHTVGINMTTWLITGGCGFIGTSLIKQLRHRYPEARVRVLDSLLVGTRADLAEVCDYRETAADSTLDIQEGPPDAVQLVVGDIKDFDTVSRCCEGIDIIVHLAANTGVAPSVEDPRTDMETNVIGTFNMLEAARRNGVQRFIFASSGAPVGETEPPIHEEKAPRPVSPYGASKLAGEGYCSAYYRTFGVKTVSLRFGNIYGPLIKTQKQYRGKVHQERAFR